MYVYHSGVCLFFCFLVDSVHIVSLFCDLLGNIFITEYKCA